MEMGINDFHFRYNGSDWIIEYDGIQHFEEIPFFHKDNDKFRYNQTIDMSHIMLIIKSFESIILIVMRRILNSTL